MDLLQPGAALDLNRIRAVLNRLEDTIIFSLIERAQFAHNAKIYDRNAFKDVLHKDGFEGSWLEWFLLQTETMHAKVRRYESPDEHSFTPRHLLPEPLLPALQYPRILQANSINVNDRILDFYVNQIVPSITKRASQAVKAGDDDQNYGSSATRDLEALQAISRRVHYGLFVAESKFISDPSAFIPHILKPNPEQLLALITKPAVEAALLKRLAHKALTYGQDIGAQADQATMKIDVDEVVKLYEQFVIPLTKVCETDYLLDRLKGLSEAEIESLKSQKAS